MKPRRCPPPARARALIVLTALVLAAGCSSAISPLEVDAARVAARVKTALVNDEMVGTRVIDVRVQGGIAQLSGRVATEAEAARAVEVARAVPGITAVDSRLRVGGDPSNGTTPLGTEPPVEPSSGPVSRGTAYEFAELEAEPEVLALGASVGLANQRGRDGGTRVTLSPLVRIGSDAGLGPVVSFDWFDATPIAPPAVEGDVGRVRVRPIMGGLRYTFLIGRLSVSPSLVGGYSINSLRVPDAGAVERLSVGVSNSWAWRPGVSFWVESGRRTALHLSIGRVFTSPSFTVVEDGVLQKRSLSADTTVVLIGMAYKVF